MISNEILKDFWAKIAPLQYLVMRNYVDMVSDLNAGGDIDLLVENKEYFIKLTGAIPLHNGKDCYNYKVLIEGQEIPIDVRVIGDGYYDARWEEDMLRHRKLQCRFYVMGRDDYKYSIIYHCLIHKSRVTDKYQKMLCEEFNLSNIDCSRKQLAEFLKNHDYKACKPKDKGVYFNRKQYVKLNMERMIRIRPALKGEE